MFDPKFVFIRDQERSREYLFAPSAVRAGAAKVEGPYLDYRVHLDGNTGVKRPFAAAKRRAVELLTSKPVGTVVYLDVFRSDVRVDRVRFRKADSQPPVADTRGPLGLDRVEGYVRLAYPKARFAGDCVCKPLDHGDCAAVDYFDTSENMANLRDELISAAAYFHLKYLILFDRIYFFDTAGNLTSVQRYGGQYHAHIHISVYGGIYRSAC